MKILDQDFISRIEADLNANNSQLIRKAKLVGILKDLLDTFRHVDQDTRLFVGPTLPANTVGSNGDQFINNTTWNWYERIQGVWTETGNIKGADGQNVQLRKSLTAIQWSNGGVSWADLISIEELKGPQGDPFLVDAKGTLAGRAAYDNEAEGFGYQDLDAGELYFRKGAAGNWTGPFPFGRGADGKSIEIRNTGTNIETRQTGDASWSLLVALADLKGDKGDGGIDGREVELRNSGTALQWRYVGDTVWTDLFQLSALQGAAGVSVSDMAIDANYHLIITLSDGSVIDAGLLPSSGGGGSGGPIDKELNINSTNAVENQAIAKAVFMTMTPATFSGSLLNWGKDQQQEIVGGPTTITGIAGIETGEWRIYILDGIAQRTLVPSASFQVNGTDPGTGVRILRVLGKGTKAVAWWLGETEVAQDFEGAIETTSTVLKFDNAYIHGGLGTAAYPAAPIAGAMTLSTVSAVKGMTSLVHGDHTLAFPAAVQLVGWLNTNDGAINRVYLQYLSSGYVLGWVLGGGGLSLGLAWGVNTFSDAAGVGMQWNWRADEYPLQQIYHFVTGATTTEYSLVLGISTAGVHSKKGVNLIENRKSESIQVKLKGLTHDFQPANVKVTGGAFPYTLAAGESIQITHSIPDMSDFPLEPLTYLVEIISQSSGASTLNEDIQIV